MDGAGLLEGRLYSVKPLHVAVVSLTAKLQISNTLTKADVEMSLLPDPAIII